jgi:hypothetical protein
MRRAVVILLSVLAVLLPATAASANVPSPKVPPDCTIAPGRVAVLPAPAGVHHAVMVTTLNISCTTQYAIREGVTLNRYWVSSHVWTAERKVKKPPSGNVIGSIMGWNDLIYCNVSGALMSVSVTYKFFSPVDGKIVSNVAYYGRSNAICSA